MFSIFSKRRFWFDWNILFCVCCSVRFWYLLILWLFANTLCFSSSSTTRSSYSRTAVLLSSPDFILNFFFGPLRVSESDFATRMRFFSLFSSYLIGGRDVLTDIWSQNFMSHICSCRVWRKPTKILGRKVLEFYLYLGRESKIKVLFRFCSILHSGFWHLRPAGLGFGPK